MTKVVFIASLLFLLSVIFKSNLEGPGEATPVEASASDSWSNKVAGLATGLNDLLASEPTGAGQATNGQNNAIKTQTPSKVVVREELVDPAKYDSALTKSDDGKLAAVLPQTKAGINPAGLPLSTVPFASSNGGTSPSSGGAGPASSPNGATANRQLANTSANTARSATMPIGTSPAEGQSAEDAMPKVTEQAGKFYVQYGIFSSACRSEQVKDKLAQAGIYSVMDKLDPEGEQWIVKSKAYASRAEAIYNLQTAQRKGYESYLVTAN